MDLKEALDIARNYDEKGHGYHRLTMSEANYLIRRAYLAEHPPDDDEPITREWWHEEISGSNLINIGDAALWYDNGAIELHLYQDWIPLPFLTTRGDVRRLIRALGGK